MQNFIIKIKDAIKSIEEEKGQFKIKSLVTRDLDNGLWDLILSADWFDPNSMKRLEYLTGRILGDLDARCMSHFSAIITFDVDTTSPLIETLLKVQENNRLGKYNDLGQGYTIVESYLDNARLIIPLNSSEMAQ